MYVNNYLKLRLSSVFSYHVRFKGNWEFKEQVVILHMKFLETGQLGSEWLQLLVAGKGCVPCPEEVRSCSATCSPLIFIF